MSRTVIFAAAALALAAWQPLRTAAASESAIAQVKTIGIISALGDTLHHVYVGATAFTNDTEGSEEIADWKLDDTVIAEFTSQLAGRFDVRPVTYSRSDFSAAASGTHSERDFGERIGRTKPDGSAAYDAYIIVRNIENNDFVARTNQHLFGPGLYRRHGIFGGNMDAVFVSCDVTIVDGHTGKEIDTIVMLTPGGESLFFPGQPAQHAIKDLWDDHFTLPPAQRRQVQDAFKTMLHDGIALSLRRLELVPKT